MSERPCKFCIAVWASYGSGDHQILPELQDCEFTHRDDQRVYDLARAMAKVFQDRHPSDAQIGYFLDDADAVIDDFDPAPVNWRVRSLPNDFREFDARFRINDVTYVLQPGEKTKSYPVRLSTYRSWQREADCEH